MPRRALGGAAALLLGCSLRAAVAAEAGILIGDAEALVQASARIESQRDVSIKPGQTLEEILEPFQEPTLEPPMSSPKARPRNDIYISAVDTLEDLMHWAVLYFSLKKQHSMHPMWMVIRKDSELNQRAHAIRLAIYGNYWRARVELFEPEKNLNLNLAAIRENTWQQVAAFQWNPDMFTRVVMVSPDSIALQNIDEITRNGGKFVMARDQGDCKNLTDAMTTRRPSMNLFSLVPDERTNDWLTGGPTIRLGREHQTVGLREDAQAGADRPKGREQQAVGLRRREEQADADRQADPPKPLESLTNASMVQLAYMQAHPERQEVRFSTQEVVSVNCLLKHKDPVLDKNNILGSMRLLVWGTEGRRIINEILQHGEKRLTKISQGLSSQNKTQLVVALRTWWQYYNHPQVRQVIDAAKNGALAEW